MALACDLSKRHRIAVLQPNIQNPNHSQCQVQAPVCLWHSPFPDEWIIHAYREGCILHEHRSSYIPTHVIQHLNLTAALLRERSGQRLSWMEPIQHFGRVKKRPDPVTGQQPMSTSMLLIQQSGNRQQGQESKGRRGKSVVSHWW